MVIGAGSIWAPKADLATALGHGEVGKVIVALLPLGLTPHAADYDSNHFEKHESSRNHDSDY